MADFDALTLFGLFAVTAMLVCYALEGRSRWFVLGFAGACVLGSIYGLLAVWGGGSDLGARRAAALGRQAALTGVACRPYGVLERRRRGSDGRADMSIE
jgi:hypothetical protein